MIDIFQGDITQLKVEAIVNAANHSLLGGGGVDGAIHHAAGSQLFEACKKLDGCETGDAKITPGFNLLAKYVIHTVGPVWHGGSENEAELLKHCYQRCFEVASQNNIKSIALPGISTGVYGYPKDKAVKVAVSVMREYEPQFEKIIACTFNTEDEQRYKEMLSL